MTSGASVGDADRCCVNCDGVLSGRATKYCSPECQKDKAREARLAAVFDITPAEYDAILQEQGGGCGICGRAPTVGKRHAVDHDHQTGFIRGLLCYPCNKRVIGARSAAILIKSAAYVSNPPAFAVLGNRVAPGRPKKKRRSRPRGRRKQ